MLHVEIRLILLILASAKVPEVILLADKFGICELGKSLNCCQYLHLLLSTQVPVHGMLFEPTND